MDNKKVFLFDLGNVLVDWNPAPYFRSFFPDDTGFHAFMRHFDSLGHAACEKNWPVVLANADIPLDYHKVLHAFVLDGYKECIRDALHDTVEILQKIHATGRYKIYAASNWDKDTFAATKHKYPFFSLFDGMQISGEVGLVKPNADFYTHMMTVFDFKPEEAIFVDDNADNIQTASRLGLHAIQFTTPRDLSQALSPFINLNHPQDRNTP